MAELDYGKAAFDHVADLQDQINFLGEQILILAVAAIALGVALTFVSWKLWRP